MTFFFVVFAAMGANTLASFIFMSRALAILRTRYESIWVELGRPTLFMNNSVQNVLAVQGFLWSSRAGDLLDPELSVLARRIRATTVVQVVLIPVAALAMFLPSASAE